jgi:Dolichyl-phosphate-mannose-protein mannosyltransferase
LSSRVGFALAVALLLLGVALRMGELSRLPAGLNEEEITDVRVAETVRQGDIEVFYKLSNGEGREGVYHAAMTAITSLIGNGLFGYHIVAVWAGMLALAMAYALASRLFGALAGVAALGLLAVNMWMILLSREVGRETMLPLLVLTIMLLLARGLSVYQQSHSRLPVNAIFAALGLLLGIGFYIHPAHFMIALFSMIFIVYQLLSRQKLSRQVIGYLLFSLLVMMIVSVPYLVSSIRLPSLSGAARVFGQYNALQTPPLQAIGSGISGILFLGDANPVHNLPGRPLIDLVSGLLVLLGILVAIRHWRLGRYGLPLIATVTLIPVAFLSAASPDFLAYTPLVPVLALFFGLGVSTLYRSLTPGPRGLARLGILILLLFNLAWTGRDLFTIWPHLPPVYDAYHSRLGELAQHVDQTAASLPTVICDSGERLHPQDELSATDLLLLMLNRKEAHLRYVDCGTGLILVNGGQDEQVIMPNPDTLDKMQAYLKNWLAEGTVLKMPGIPHNGVVQLNATQLLADTVGKFSTTAPAGFAPEATGGPGLATTPIRLGGNITFLGYEPAGTNPYTPGGVVTSITYWRVDGEIPPDLRLFTHILSDPAACCAAQNDTISVDVSELESRDVFIQLTFVPLPPTIPDGMYSVSVGAYLASNGTRMGVMDGDRERGTRLFLGQITVKRS